MTTEEIVSMVAAAYGVSPRQIRGKLRRRRLVDARVSAARILRARGYSYPEIGQALGGRHHTTAMNLCGTLIRKRKSPRVLTEEQRHAYKVLWATREAG